MDLVGRALDAKPIARLECKAGIVSEGHREAQVPGRADGGLDGVVSGDAGDNQGSALNPIGQTGAEKGAARGFAKDRFARCRRGLWPERMQGLAGAILRVRLPRIMADVNNRPAAAPPVFEQSTHVGFGFGVISPSPRRIIDRELEINQDERRAHSSLRIMMSSSNGKQSARCSAR